MFFIEPVIGIYSLYEILLLKLLRPVELHTSMYLSQTGGYYKSDVPMKATLVFIAANL